MTTDLSLQTYIRSRSVTDENSCWIWQGKPGKRGSGKYTRDSNTVIAHFGAWSAWHGPVPSSMRVKHHCQSRMCVNPEHLHLVKIKGLYAYDLEFIKENSVVNPSTDCWEWTDRLNGNGYATVAVGSGNVLMHRAALIASGVPIPSGYQACHKCDNRKCVNPSHLFVGTANDNQQDKVLKGRQSRGVHRWNALLDDQRVRLIRESTASARQIAEELGVSGALISAVRRRKVWRHVA